MHGEQSPREMVTEASHLLQQAQPDPYQVHKLWPTLQ